MKIETFDGCEQAVDYGLVDQVSILKEKNPRRNKFKVTVQPL